MPSDVLQMPLPTGPSLPGPPAPIAVDGSPQKPTSEPLGPLPSLRWLVPEENSRTGRAFPRLCFYQAPMYNVHSYQLSQLD